MTDVSVVVPHYGDDRLLDQCCDALNRYSPDVELIVVDNNRRNVGFAAGCNQGFARSTGDVVVFLNNDCFVHEGWLPPLLSALAEPAVGAAGALLFYPDGRIQHAGVDLGMVDGVLTAWNVQGPAVGGPVRAVTGALMAVRRDAFVEVGGFDEGYWCGYEDVDLCLALGAAGWEVRFVPESTATHLESVSGAERWRAVRANVQRLQDKWATREVAR